MVSESFSGTLDHGGAPGVEHDARVPHPAACRTAARAAPAATAARGHRLAAASGAGRPISFCRWPWPHQTPSAQRWRAADPGVVAAHRSASPSSTAADATSVPAAAQRHAVTWMRALAVWRTAYSLRRRSPSPTAHYSMRPPPPRGAELEGQLGEIDDHGGGRLMVRPHSRYATTQAAASKPTGKSDTGAPRARDRAASALTLDVRRPAPCRS